MSTEDRRGLVSFDPDYFSKRSDAGVVEDAQDRFRHAYLSNHWQAASPSGPGSSAEQTARIAAAIPGLCRRLGVKRLLDLPCGDFSWMSNVELDGIDYMGGDIVPEIVAANADRYAGPGRSFMELDLVSSDLPAADLLLCRDCLVHLSNADILAALRNIARSDITFVLTTTFPDEEHNTDITTGDWRPINLMMPPFDLPRPAELLNEGCSESGGVFADKALALWRRTDIAPNRASP